MTETLRLDVLVEPRGLRSGRWLVNNDLDVRSGQGAGQADHFGGVGRREVWLSINKDG